MYVSALRAIINIRPIETLNTVTQEAQWSTRYRLDILGISFIQEMAYGYLWDIE
jgi:hypothetical protein